MNIRDHVGSGTWADGPAAKMPTAHSESSDATIIPALQTEYSLPTGGDGVLIRRRYSHSLFITSTQPTVKSSICSSIPS